MTKAWKNGTKRLRTLQYVGHMLLTFMVCLFCTVCELSFVDDLDDQLDSFSALTLLVWLSGL